MRAQPVHVVAGLRFGVALVVRAVSSLAFGLVGRCGSLTRRASSRVREPSGGRG
jgi:hypothetical protein